MALRALLGAVFTAEPPSGLAGLAHLYYTCQMN